MFDLFYSNKLGVEIIYFMAWRTKYSLYLPWYVSIPFLVLLFELIASRFYPFSSPYFSLLIWKQPVLLSFHSIIALSRVFSVYFFFAFGIECITRSLINPALRSILFLFPYTVTFQIVFAQFPGLKECFPYFSKTKVVLLSGFLVFLLWHYRKRVALTPIGKRWFLFIFIPLFLVVTRQSPWSGTFHTKDQLVSNKPSFFVLSFDAIPGDLFFHEGAAPRWKDRWKERSVVFKNAYSVTNSTYTSWFSTLTGKMPLDSGVLSLYPNHREGNTVPADWIPKRLQELGYQTAFLTDCANTSFMKEAFGFDVLYQPDQGAFRSARALMTSVHPGLFALSRWQPAAWFFPELTSFSSHQYDPTYFFQTVDETREKLDSTGSPYFLVVHSCITHRDMARHLPDVESPLRKDLPQWESYKSEALSELFLSIRRADYFTDRLFSSAVNPKSSPWMVLTSDHGVRIDPHGNQLEHFSHGIGDAHNRYQYNVPLAILPPAENALSNDIEKLVTVQDLGKFILEVSQSSSRIHSYPIRQHLVLTSAVPSQTPHDWGRTLVPLVSRGELDQNGTFRFSGEDDENLNGSRSRALLSLPYRLVWKPGDEWDVFNELEDPFNLNALDLEKTFQKSPFLSMLVNSRPSSLMAN